MSGLEPSEGTLEHLRRAVPARRARRRQAVVGIAAAVVLVGTAVPALVHVASSGGISADKAVNAGHGEQAQGGTGTETGVEGGQKSHAPPAGTASPEQGGTGGAGKPSVPVPGSGGEAGTPTSPPVTSPTCEAGQLSVSAVQSGAPDADGKVYGSFRIANVSGKDCMVGGPGHVGFQAKGAADAAKITVVEHTFGDAANGLPDPTQESPTLVLTPANAYEVRFAWVPSETCPTTNPTPTPTPTPSSGGGGPASNGGATGGSAGTGTTGNPASAQLLTDGTPADGSVAVTHTAEAGGPVAEATIPNACAGTIYRTGVLDAS
ncbi:hypothetical protein VO63_24985 [Streptomyces showdoensis]|uniref:DUF4232 domain-containing protein n=1 Tax=Streptomyces showdoensis TaxID=68268 RepID=A0A2P2GI91_STREW|nr:hypothetical protein VO63_24985 [Streptomyces showdoensis]